MYLLLEQATNELKADGVEPSFGDFASLAFEDRDFEILYDMASDGIEDTQVGVSMGDGNLEFGEWFDPFLNATSPVHPYGTEDAG